MTEKIEVKEYKLVKVATQTEDVIQAPTGDILDTQQALVELLNKVDKLLSKF